MVSVSSSERSREKMLLHSIASSVSRELRRYNPLVLETVKHVSGESVSGFAPVFLNALKITMSEVLGVSRHGELEWSDLVHAVEKTRVATVLFNTRVKESEANHLYLSDLRKLGLIKTVVKQNRGEHVEIPALLPVSGNVIEASGVKHHVTYLVNEKALSHEITRGILLSFFSEARAFAETVIDTYLEHGVVDVNASFFTECVYKKLQLMYRSLGVRHAPRMSRDGFLKTLMLVFEESGFGNPVRDGRVVISNEAVEYVLRELGYIPIDYGTYIEALREAWREYWGEMPPWYASLENFAPYVNRALSRLLGKPVNPPLTLHLMFVKNLSERKIVEYRYGGLDPDRKHWIRFVEKS